jgi:hypothetical protein
VDELRVPFKYMSSQKTIWVAQWLKSVILCTWEAEIRKIKDWGESVQKVTRPHLNLWQMHSMHLSSYVFGKHKLEDHDQGLPGNKN